MKIKKGIMKIKKKTFKNGLIGELSDVLIYCNEKDKKRGKFLFKCCLGCKHNPIKNGRNKE
jgi:hypothetical protein